MSFGSARGSCFIQKYCAESSGNAADHNLDLSLGNSIPKQNSLALGNDSCNAAPMPLIEADWQNRGLFRPKVVHLSIYLSKLNFNSFQLLQICKLIIQSSISTFSCYKQEVCGVEGDAHRRDGYSESETMQLLARSNLQSPSSNEMQRCGQGQFIRRPGDTQTLPSFPPPPNYHVGIYI